MGRRRPGQGALVSLNHDTNIDYGPIVEAVIDVGAYVEAGWGEWWRRQSPLFPSSKEHIAQLLERKR